MFKFAAGKRTYVIATVMVIASGLYYQGFLSEPVFKAVEGILLGGGLAALRAGVNAGK